MEGPENSVYVRGKSNTQIIKLPDYWHALVHHDSLTVSITPCGEDQGLYVIDTTPWEVLVGGKVQSWYYYMVMGERKDVPRLEVEI